MDKCWLHIGLALIVGCAIGPWLEALTPAVKVVWNGYRR